MNSEEKRIKGLYKLAARFGVVFENQTPSDVPPSPQPNNTDQTTPAKKIQITLSTENKKHIGL